MAHQIPKLKCFSSRLAVVFAQYIEAKRWVQDEDVVGAAPTGTSTIQLPTKVRLILETWRYLFFHRPVVQELLLENVPNIFISSVMKTYAELINYRYIIFMWLSWYKNIDCVHGNQI